MEPSPGEDQPHVPPPSLWPVGFAIGIACILVGVIVNPTLIVPIGILIAAVFGFLWIRDASAEYRHVPEVEPETRAASATAPALPAHEGGPAMPESTPAERFPRNKFLEFATIGIGGAIGGMVTLPAIGFAVLPAFTEEEPPEIDLGPLENFPQNQFVIATFLSDPEIGEVSRRTAYVRYNGTADGKTSFTIVSNRCVHLGCPTQVAGVPNEEAATEIDGVDGEGSVRVRLTPTIGGAGFNCPCHGGAYDPEGNRTAGPPVRALDRYNFKISNGNLVLLQTYSVGKVEGTGAEAQITAYEAVGPGIHVDGPEAILYPFEAGDF